MSVTDLCNVVPCWDMTEDEWLEARQSGIGGSEIGPIAGLSKYESAYAIWARKVHNISTFDGNDATDLGNDLERTVAQIYARESGHAVVEWKVILRSKEHAFLSANVDFFVVEESEQFPAGYVTTWEYEEEPPGIQGILECKTGALASPGKPEEWYNEQVPISYECQGAWYLAATGLPWVEFACLLGGHGMQYRFRPRDDEMIVNLLTIGEQFWNDYVLTGDPPPLDGSDSTDEALKAMYPASKEGVVLEGGEELWSAWTEFQEAKTLAEEYDKARKAARAKVVGMMGDAEEGKVDGTKILTFRNNQPTKYFDLPALQRDFPDIHAKYLKTKPGNRVLRKASGS